VALRPAHLLPPKRLLTPRSARRLSATNRGLLPGFPALTRVGLAPTGLVQLPGRTMDSFSRAAPSIGSRGNSIASPSVIRLPGSPSLLALRARANPPWEGPAPFFRSQDSGHPGRRPPGSVPSVGRPWDTPPRTARGWSHRRRVGGGWDSDHLLNVLGGGESSTVRGVHYLVIVPRAGDRFDRLGNPGKGHHDGQGDEQHGDGHLPALRTISPTDASLWTMAHSSGLRSNESGSRRAKGTAARRRAGTPAAPRRIPCDNAPSATGQ